MFIYISTHIYTHDNNKHNNKHTRGEKNEYNTSSEKYDK